MKLIILLTLLTSCIYTPPAFEEWTEKKMKPMMKQKTIDMACKGIAYREYCFDGVQFASKECKEKFNLCMENNTLTGDTGN